MIDSFCQTHSICLICQAQRGFLLFLTVNLGRTGCPWCVVRSQLLAHYVRSKAHRAKGIGHETKPLEVGGALRLRLEAVGRKELGTKN
jgi:hypothetical protein